MSFKKVQAKIEGEGYSKEAAGAILAKKTREASPAAKKANPKLNKVKGAAPKKKPNRFSAGAVVSRKDME